MNEVMSKFMGAQVAIKLAAGAVADGEVNPAQKDASPSNGRAILNALGQVDDLPELLQAAEDVYACLKSEGGQASLVQSVIRYAEARAAFIGPE